MYARNLRLERLQLVMLDATAVFCALLLAVWLRHGAGLFPGTGEAATPWREYLFPGVILAGVFVLLMNGQRLYPPRCGRLGEALRVLVASGAGTAAGVALSFFYRGYSYSRATVLIFFPLSVLGLLAARSLFRAYRRAVYSSPAAARRVILVGFGRTGERLARALERNPGYYHVVGVLDDDPAKLGLTVGGARVVGPTTELGDLARRGEADEVILALPSAGRRRTLELIGDCLAARIPWKLVPDFHDLLLDRVQVDFIGELPVVGLRGSRIVGLNWAWKRAFDIAFSAAVLVASLPLLLAIAAAVKLGSRGPVLFKQTRVGLHGREFPFLKFRTMHLGSGSTIHRDYTRDWIYGRTGKQDGSSVRSVGAAAARPPVTHKIRSDPRVTRVGRWLRKTSLDELPQFWNVLRGQMSVVGPRPAIPYEVARYTEWHRRRLEVLPGITGLWQVSGRNALSFEEMVRLDIRYVETWSLAQDLRIVLKTLPSMLFGNGH